MNFDIEISMPSRIDLMGGEILDKTNESLVLCTQPEYELGCAVVDESADDQRLHGFPEKHPIDQYLKGIDYCDAVWMHYNPQQDNRSDFSDQTLSAMVYYACRILNEGQHAFDYEDKLQLLENLRKDFPNQFVEPVIAQISGGICTINTQTFDLDEHEWPEDYQWSFIGLPQYKSKNLNDSQSIVEVYREFTSYWQQKKWQNAWESMNTYHDLLQAQSLVPQDMTEQVSILRAIENVQAVKFCGQLGMSGLFIVHQGKNTNDIKATLRKNQIWHEQSEIATGIQLNFGVS